jgi:ubiquitin related modifier 1
MASKTMPITVDFTYFSSLPSTLKLLLISRHSGGLEMLFSNLKTHKIDLPLQDDDGNAIKLAFLINFLCKNLMKDTRKEMFILDGHM